MLGVDMSKYLSSWLVAVWPNMSTPGEISFKVWTERDLPATWQRPVRPDALAHQAKAVGTGPVSLQSTVALDLPDHPTCVQWFQWRQRRTGALPVILVNQDDYNQARGARATLECLSEIHYRGRASAYFQRLFCQAAEPLRGQQ